MGKHGKEGKQKGEYYFVHGSARVGGLVRKIAGSKIENGAMNLDMGRQKRVENA